MINNLNLSLMMTKNNQESLDQNRKTVDVQYIIEQVGGKTNRMFHFKSIYFCRNDFCESANHSITARN